MTRSRADMLVELERAKEKVADSQHQLELNPGPRMRAAVAQYKGDLYRIARALARLDGRT